MNSEQRTVLIVDDAADNIRLISGILKGSYKTKAATSGEKALRIAQNSPQPSAILLDVIMPEMDGHEVCRRLKMDPATCNIPVIFVSGNDSEEERSKGLSLGAVDYCTKPIDPQKVLAILEQILS